jgi:hypothetical protein
MFLEVFQPVNVAHDLEVETPIIVHAALPDVASLVIFLGSERRVMEILGEEAGAVCEKPYGRREGRLPGRRAPGR